ncbi:MAG TPA: hypothetical protein V6D05_06390 [Stenomitos sp.]
MRGIFWAKLVDRQQLLSRIDPCYRRVFADHVTLQAKTDLTPELRRLLGRQTRAHVRGVAWDEQIQAVEVDLPPELVAWCQNDHPHITVSSDGTPPVRSNDMLEHAHQEIPCDFWIDLELQFKPFR